MANLCHSCRKIFQERPGFIEPQFPRRIIDHNDMGNRWPGDIHFPEVPGSDYHEEGCPCKFLSRIRYRVVMPTARQSSVIHWQSFELESSSTSETSYSPSENYSTSQTLFLTNGDCELCAILLRVIILHLPDLKPADWSLDIYPDRAAPSGFFRIDLCISDTVYSSWTLLHQSRSDRDSFQPTSSPRLSYQADMKLVRDWFHECLSEVEDVKETLPSSIRSFMPTRLLQVTRSSPIPVIRLVLSAQLPQSTTYFALSHQWGAKPSLKLKQETLKSFKADIPWASIPKTFQDAISVTISLGSSYIWIDALCIIQNSKSDWLEQASQMADVYSHSTLNIVADHSNDPIDGIFQDRDYQVLTNFHIETTWPRLKNSSWRIFTSGEQALDDRLRLQSGLARRGWVVQDECLSPRLLFLGRHDIQWLCHHGFANKGCQKIRGYALDQIENCAGPWLRRKMRIRELLRCGSFEYVHDERLPMTVEQKLLAWDSVVERYAPTRITNATDKLVAISGITSRMSRVLGFEGRDYIAGLWKPLLLRQLCWAAGNAMREILYRAPTWSWASLNVDNLSCYSTSFCDYLLSDLVNSDCCTRGGPFGEVDWAYIDVKSYIWELSIQSSHRDDRGSHLVSFSTSCGKCQEARVWWDVETDFQLPLDAPMKSYFMALAMDRQGHNLTGLMLEADLSISGSYRRLGFAQIPLSALMHGQCSADALAEDRYLDIHVNSGVIQRTLDAKEHGEDPFSWDPSRKTVLEVETEGESQFSQESTTSVESQDKMSYQQASLNDGRTTTRQKGDGGEQSPTGSDVALLIGDDVSSQHITKDGSEFHLPVGKFDIRYTIRIL